MASIREFYNTKEIYGLPGFQRKFSWTKSSKVEDFWDSIFNKYAIPRFFTWDFQGQYENVITLHKFSHVFNGRTALPTDLFSQEELEEHNDELRAICDGQQRLTSILIGLCGYNFANSAKSQVEKYLYWDLLANPDIENVDGNKRFQFLDDASAAKQNKLRNDHGKRTYAWVKIKDFFDWACHSEFMNPAGETLNFDGDSTGKWIYYLGPAKTGLLNGLLDPESVAEVLQAINRGVVLDLDSAEAKFVLKNLNILWRQIDQADDYLDFHDISESVKKYDDENPTFWSWDIDKAVQFFVRINGGGKALDPNELLFAMLAKNADAEQFGEGIDLKSDFDELINKYSKNTPNALLNYTIEYKNILRVCLYLVTNNVLFKLKSFDEENCQTILEEWPKIKSAMEATFAYMRHMKLGNYVTSFNALIPVFFHFYKKEINNPLDELSSAENLEFLKYFISAVESKDFGSHADNLLQSLKNSQLALYEDADYAFSFEDLRIDLPADKSLSIPESTIDSMLDRQLNDPLVYPLLFLLNEFELTEANLVVSGLHPHEICQQPENILVAQYNCNQQEVKFIHKNCLKAANLMILKSEAVVNRNARMLNKWLEETIVARNFNYIFDKTRVIDFLEFEYIHVPADKTNSNYLQIRNFEEVFNNRKAYMKELIKAF